MKRCLSQTLHKESVTQGLIVCFMWQSSSIRLYRNYGAIHMERIWVKMAEKIKIKQTSEVKTLLYLKKVYFYNVTVVIDFNKMYFLLAWVAIPLYLVGMHYSSSSSIFGRSPLFGFNLLESPIVDYLPPHHFWHPWLCVRWTKEWLQRFLPSKSVISTRCVAKVVNTWNCTFKHRNIF